MLKVAPGNRSALADSTGYSRYPQPEHSPYQGHHSASSAELDQLDYSYQGPFNRIEACGDELDKPQTARGIKVQMSQEESVV
jgi:hypothetical protein